MSKYYNKQFKEEALKLSDEIGVKKAASQLGLPYYTLSGWRNKRKADLLNPKPPITEQEKHIRALEKEISELRQANEILKDALSFFCKRPEEVKSNERYLYIFTNRHNYAVKLLCSVLRVNESGYYRWLRNRNKLSKRRLLLVEIQNIINEHPDNDNYGVDRILSALEQKKTY